MGNQHLTELFLYDNRLTGTIPGQWGEPSADFGGLPSLERLSLRKNQLTGQIPPGLGNLEDLEWLNLSYNQLTGPIPPDLGNLSKLEGLGLAHNRLNGTIPQRLSNSRRYGGNLGNLRQLYLGHQSPFRGGVQGPVLYNELYWLAGGIPDSLLTLSNLEVLDLSDNLLSGSIPAEGWNNLDSLQWLKLEDNRLTGAIPAALGNLDDLTILWLSGNNLSGCIPEELQDVDSHDLRLLRLRFCNEVEPTPTPGPTNNTVDRLALMAFYDATKEHSNWDKIKERIEREGGVCTFGDPSRPLNEWCGVTINSEGRVIEFELWDHGQWLRGMIPAELGDLEELTVLNLSRNRLSGEIPAGLDTDGLPTGLGKLTKLETLDLSHNRDRGKFGVGAHPGLSGRIPSEISKLQNLTELRLNNNSLGPDLLSTEVFGSNLESVDISGNEFKDNIEDALFRLLESRPAGIEGKLHVNVSGNPWKTQSEPGRQWTDHSGDVTLDDENPPEESEFTLEDLDEILELYKELREPYDRYQEFKGKVENGKLAYRVIRGADRSGALRKLGSKAFVKVTTKAGLKVVTKVSGLATLYYEATIFSNPLVQQFIRVSVLGFINGWTAERTADFFAHTVLSKAGFHCVDPTTGKLIGDFGIRSQKGLCEDPMIGGGIWVGPPPEEES